MDLVYVALIVGFFALTWGLAVLGDRLSAGGSHTVEEHTR